MRFLRLLPFLLILPAGSIPITPGVVAGWDGFRGEARQVWVEPDACVTFSRESDRAFAGLGS
jgi:hypothetical protein